VNHARHVLIAGVSARAAAESAALARFAVTAVDAFGDLDQHPAVRVAPPVDADGRFTAGAAARAALAIPSDAVAYLSPFENHPRAVAALARGRTLWGNPPDVLRRVRDPVLVAEALRRRGLPAPVGVWHPPQATWGILAIRSIRVIRGSLLLESLALSRRVTTVTKIVAAHP
jgi:hypothetical protein